MKILAFLGSMAVLAAVVGDAASLLRILWVWLCVALLVGLFLGACIWVFRRGDKDAEAMGLTDDRCRCCGGAGGFPVYGDAFEYQIPCEACKGGGLQPKGDA